MALLSSYSKLSLVFVAYVTNFFTAGLLAVFALRFFSWYRNGNHSLGILLYALAFIILATAEVFAGVGSGYLLWEKDDIITPASEVHFRNFPEGSLLDIFFSSYSYVDYSSFLLTLVASALLLYHYSKKARTPKMIIIIALPILGYTATILDASIFMIRLQIQISLLLHLSNTSCNIRRRSLRLFFLVHFQEVA